MKIKYLIWFSILLLLAYVSLHQFNIISRQFFNASLLAVGLNTFNFGIAVWLFQKSLDKSNKTFLFYNLGGLGMRLFILLIAIVLILNSLKIDKYGFILQFFIFYFLLISLEIAFFHKTMLDRSSNN
jgi:hypothetical protein